MVQFAYPLLGFIGLFFLCCVIAYRLTRYKSIIYNYSLVSFFKTQGVDAAVMPRYIVNALRLFIFILMVFLLFKPQLVHYKNPTKVEGIDIVLALDVSESMLSFDDLHDQRSRFDVAKKEAINFIDKRKNDAIGLVIFAKNAVTRCPLTLDKSMLKSMLQDLKIGFINGDGTVIASSLLTAANRLKNSDSKSKIIIFLTDGMPTVQDISPDRAIDVLKKLNIKVYTIGVGSQEGGFFNHPFLGVVRAQTTLNTVLLEKIAAETGGEFFLAKNPKDIERIYNHIDQLEKTKHETTMYYSYYDFFMPILMIIALLVGIELILSTFMWFVL